MSTISSDNISDNLFGAAGVRDPQYFKNGVAISRVINFGVSNAASSMYYKMIALPKRFVALGIFVEELEACDGSSNTLGIVYGTDSANSLASVSVGGDTLAASYTSVASVTYSNSVYTSTVGKFFADGDVLKVKMGAATTKGKVRVTVFGFTPDAESLEGFTADMAVPAWRTTQTENQASNNVSGGDPYTSGAGIYPVGKDI